MADGGLSSRRVCVHQHLGRNGDASCLETSGFDCSLSTPTFAFFFSLFLENLALLTLNVGSSAVTAWFLLFYSSTRALPGYWVGVQARVSQRSKKNDQLVTGF